MQDDPVLLPARRTFLLHRERHPLVACVGWSVCVMTEILAGKRNCDLILSDREPRLKLVHDM